MTESGRSVLQDSGLAQSSLTLPGLHLAEVTGRQLFTYRGHPEGLTTPPGWPLSVGEVHGTDPAVCCLRPGEWLWLSSTEEPPDQASHGLDCIDQSHGWAVLRVAGRNAPWLLAQLGTLDFFALGLAMVPSCDQTRMGHARVVVFTHPAAGDEGAVHDLLVERSLARDLWERLVAAAAQAQPLAQRAGARGPGSVAGFE